MKNPGRKPPGFAIVARAGRRRHPPGRHHKIVQTGTGLLRSHRRNAHSLASTMEGLRAHPPDPRPAARQTQAEASVGASVSNEAATTSKARIRPMAFSLDPAAPL
jgi:hypothetical protein